MSAACTVLLLDSNVWSHLVLGQPERQAQIQADLQNLLQQHPQAVLATSALSVAECLVGARRLLDPAQRAAAEAELQRQFSSPHLLIVPVSATVLDRAADLRAHSLRQSASTGHRPPSTHGGKLKLPDAIIAASCLDFDPPAILVTENTKDFICPGASGSAQTVANLVVASVGGHAVSPPLP